jgi:hypothetical protein
MARIRGIEIIESSLRRLNSRIAQLLTKRQRLAKALPTAGNVALLYEASAPVMQNKMIELINTCFTGKR